ncbi:MAG TPA: putative Ig domain-containing protein, partial [Candidatus Obscuribacterales bacterium]
MSKLATRCSAILIASGLSGLLTGCPQQPPPNTNVRPIPNTAPTAIVPTPADGSVIVNPSPFPTGIQPSGSFPDPAQTPIPPGLGQLAISTTTLPTGVLNFNYNVPLAVVNGSGSYRWSVLSGNLPVGLSIDPNTGQIFGTPTQTGTFSFEVQVIDNQKALVARRTMFILISDTDNGLNNLSILTDDLPSAVVDRRYSRILEINGGSAPFSWDITAGSLPDGLDLNPTTGEISGTPTLKGEETFTVRATDSRGQTRSRTLSLTVNSTDTDIAILTSSLAVAVNNQSYDPGSCSAFDPSLTNQIQATGGDVEDLDDYRWSISKGSLPSGMSLSSTTGRLTGSPSVSTPQVFTFTVKVRDDADNSTSKVFSLEVRDSAIYGFTPATGGQNLFVTLFGEGLGGADDVFFGQNHPDGVAADVTAVDTTDCDEVTTQVPVGAPIGLLSVRDAGDGVIGTTIAPFISENVVISEVFTNPADTERQYIELRNLGPSSVNLSGWFLSYTRIDGVLDKVPVPAQTLNANSVTVVDLQNEMRFDPGALTQVALCKGFACDNNTVDLSRYRDYLQFGAAGDGGNLENNARFAGLWNVDDSTVPIDDLQTTLQDVDADPSGGDPDAHYGVRENSYNQSGLLLLNGNAEYTGYTGDAVLYYTPSGGAQAGRQQRIKRTVKGVGPIAPGSNPDVDAGLDADRVVFDSPFMKSTILSSNTGDGSEGKGITVDDLRFFSPGDFVNVLTGSAVRTITALSGRRIELDTVLSADIQNYDAVDGNTSDGTTDDLNFLPQHMPGFRVCDKQAQFVSGNSTVNIVVHEDVVGEEFTVTRTVVSTPDADHIVVNQALATAALSGNTGDGNPILFYDGFQPQFDGAFPFRGAEITVASSTNFFT